MCPFGVCLVEENGLHVCACACVHVSFVCVCLKGLKGCKVKSPCYLTN